MPVVFFQTRQEAFTRPSNLFHFQVSTMSHFVIFSNERLEGVQDYMDRLNETGNTVDFVQIWDATTRELGGAAFAHHAVYPGDTLVVVPSVLNLLSWDEEVGLYLPFFSSVEAAVASFAETFHDILVNLLSVPVPCRIIFTDLVGVDCLNWALVTQHWVDSVVPRVNEEVDQANAWNGVPNVPLGWRIQGLRQTVDGVLSINDYRTMPDGYLPSRGQQRQWARTLINLLGQYMDMVYHN